jgi:hypothetical protein
MHSLDYTTEQGLLDLLTLGNIVSISHLLDPRGGLDRGLQQAAEAERCCIQADFLAFQDAFSKRFFLLMDGIKVHPQDALFDPFFLQLLITVVKYKQMMQNTFDATFSFKALYSGVLEHLQKHHSHLASTFVEDMKKENAELPYLRFFQWSKPFTIVPGVHQDQDTEMDSTNEVDGDDEKEEDVEMEGISHISLIYNYYSKPIAFRYSASSSKDENISSEKEKDSFRLAFLLLKTYKLIFIDSSDDEDYSVSVVASVNKALHSSKIALISKKQKKQSQ